MNNTLLSIKGIDEQLLSSIGAIQQSQQQIVNNTAKFQQTVNVTVSNPDSPSEVAKESEKNMRKMAVEWGM